MSNFEEQAKTQAQSYLLEAQRILRHLAADRRHEARRRPGRARILSEVKEILRGP